jgi:mono/diheme cytochrome c family protein
MNRSIQKMQLTPKPLLSLALLAISLAVTGCGKMEPPQFRINTQGMDPDDFRVTSADKDEEQKLAKEQSLRSLGQISTILYAWFGTPDEPYVLPESGLDLRKVQMAAGPARFDPDSNQRGLYRRHCAHCHGISGDGAGPTAAFLNPYPRDYRQGQFKFKSTIRSARPTTDDLHRILKEGIAGTAMPSFLLLPPDEIDALAEYVKYLSMRGQAELLLDDDLLKNDETINMDKPEQASALSAELIEKYLAPVAAPWQSAESEILEPENVPEFKDEAEKAAFIAKGAVLFQNEKVQCAKCHGPTALGDGSEENLFDDWNKVKQFDTIAKNIAEAEKIENAKDRKEQLATLYHLLEIENQSWLLPPQQLQPRNLRLGIYRFGRRPIDVYRRISAGINGTPMGTMGATPESPSGLKPEEIWQLVYYVRSLPYEKVSEPSVGRGQNVAGVHP